MALVIGFELVFEWVFLSPCLLGPQEWRGYKLWNIYLKTRKSAEEHFRLQMEDVKKIFSKIVFFN